MAIRTLTRLFDSHDDATATVQALEAAGFSHDDVSIVASNHDTRYTSAGSGTDTVAAAEAGGTGAGIGAAVAGGVGGLVGSLTQAGVPEHDAHVYAEGVRRGGSLVTVRVEEARAAEAEQILNGRSHVDPTTRRAEYASTGWERFDDKAPAYVPSDTASASSSRTVL